MDDVVARFMTHLEGPASGVVRAGIQPSFSVSLRELAERIHGFRAMRDTLFAGASRIRPIMNKANASTRASTRH